MIEYGPDSCSCGRPCAPGRYICHVCLHEGEETPEQKKARLNERTYRSLLKAFGLMLGRARRVGDVEGVRYYSRQIERVRGELGERQDGVA